MNAADPWEVLRVWDRLVVGPAKVQKRRIAVPYRVERNGEVAERDHVFKWDEDVFDPDEVASQNLAAMVGSQVALNYGLFADEIVFRGPYDAADRAFLRAMIENTAREQAVKKFLEPNPYLIGSAVGIPPVRKETWCRAKLVFPDPAPKLDARPWDRGGKRIAVLSSGGKESLLSQGLLEELGYEVHALFGQESGRHWFTALNGFRWLSANRGTTARVWMDSDRQFAFAKRQLPFVRPDFASIRADEYAVRLWTVAVFLFGTVPLLRARGLPNIVIGDEFDTTRRAESHGIPHYDGLFDQSRFFDETLTKYFHAKGWGVSVFSILRTQSELQVQSRLAKRYPDLWATQVSCHAAHVEGDRVKPCGRCEKCRRVVGMLVASGHDPKTCGYTQAQIDDGLVRLANEGAHHEAMLQQHVLWLLVERGLVPKDAPAVKDAAPSREVTRLRFDPVASPADAVPEPLRTPLYRLLAEDADGAVLRDGRKWLDADPLTGGLRAP